MVNIVKVHTTLSLFEMLAVTLTLAGAGAMHSPLRCPGVAQRVRSAICAGKLLAKLLFGNWQISANENGWNLESMPHAQISSVSCSTRAAVLARMQRILLC